MACNGCVLSAKSCRTQIPMLNQLVISCNQTARPAAYWLARGKRDPPKFWIQSNSPYDYSESEFHPLHMQFLMIAHGNFHDYSPPPSPINHLFSCSLCCHNYRSPLELDLPFYSRTQRHPELRAVPIPGDWESLHPTDLCSTGSLAWGSVVGK